VSDAAVLLLRRATIALLCVLPLPILVYVYSAQLPKEYRASLIAQLDRTAPSRNAERLIPERTEEFVVASAKAQPVAAATARRLGERYSSVGGWSAGLDERAGWLTLSATAPSPRVAIDGVNANFTALADYTEAAGQRQLRAAIAAVRQTRAATRDPIQRQQAADTLSELKAAQEAPSRPLRVVQAPTGAEAIAPNPLRNAVLAVLLSVLLVPVVALVLARFDRRVRTPAQLERLTGTDLLATIPDEVFVTGPTGPRARPGLERLRDSLLFSPDRRVDTVAVVSPLGAEGRTSVATGLALAYARAGRRVVLVDADGRGPGVAGRMRVPASPGLSDAIAGHDVDDALHPVGGAHGDLRVLPAGSPSPRFSETIGSPRMSDLLNRLARRCDVVVIDTAPLLKASHTLAVVARVSGIVAVARVNRTPRDGVRRMIRITRSGGVRVVGVVATGVKPATAQREMAPEPGQPVSGPPAPARSPPSPEPHWRVDEQPQRPPGIGDRQAQASATGQRRPCSDE